MIFRIKYQQEDGERIGRWRDARGRWCLPPTDEDVVISQSRARELSAARKAARKRDAGSETQSPFNDKEWLKIRAQDVAAATNCAKAASMNAEAASMCGKAAPIRAMAAPMCAKTVTICSMAAHSKFSGYNNY